MELTIRTGRARQTYRRPMIVGYRWRADTELEVLACGHERRVDGPQYSEWFADETLAQTPRRRVCKNCPIPNRGLR